MLSANLEDHGGPLLISFPARLFSHRSPIMELAGPKESPWGPRQSRLGSKVERWASGPAGGGRSRKTSCPAALGALGLGAQDPESPVAPFQHHLIHD